MKKGISLIVLVITIIVMIIIAGAIIISLNGTNVVDRANEAVTKSDVANLKSALTLEYAEMMAVNYDPDTEEDDKIEQGNASTAGSAQYRYNAVLKQFPALEDAGYTVTANSDLTYTVVEPGSGSN